MLVVQAKLAKHLGLPEDADEPTIRAVLDRSAAEQALEQRYFPELATPAAPSDAVVARDASVSDEEAALRRLFPELG